MDQKVRISPAKGLTRISISMRPSMMISLIQNLLNWSSLEYQLIKKVNQFGKVWMT